MARGTFGYEPRLRTTGANRHRRAHLITLLATFLLAFIPSLPATAQVLTMPGPGITVFGTGTASHPADLATVQLMLGLGDRQFGFSEERDRSSGVEKISASGSETIEADASEGRRRDRHSERESIIPEQVDAMVEAVAEAAHVDPATIEATLSPLAARRGERRARNLRLDLVVEQPTPDGLTALLAATSDAAAEQGLVVEVAGARYDAADCAAIEEAAERAAIADAEVRAQRLARLLGVTLGGVVGAFGEPNYGEVEGGCSGQAGASYDSTHGGLGITVPIFDPAQPAEITVAARLTISYAIE